MQKTNDKKLIGGFELVSFPEFVKIGQINAKIDTGAFSGALHCTKIVEKSINGINTLQFSPFDHPEIVIKTSEFAVRHVKSSIGKIQNRYFINTIIEIAGEVYPIVLSLADRSEMKIPVLIGRRFLRENNFVVDVNHKTTVI